jgi:hypothetical protein
MIPQFQVGGAMHWIHVFSQCKPVHAEALARGKGIRIRFRRVGNLEVRRLNVEWPGSVSYRFSCFPIFHTDAQAWPVTRTAAFLRVRPVRTCQAPHLARPPQERQLGQEIKAN